jgi:hypothetical protein
MTQKFLDTKRQSAASSFFHYYTFVYQFLSHCSFCLARVLAAASCSGYLIDPLTTPEPITTITTPFIIQFHLFPGILL